MYLIQKPSAQTKQNATNNAGPTNNPGGSSSPPIDVVGNTIYFYSDVCAEKILGLNKALKEVSTKIQIDAIRSGGPVAPILLYIMSPGGDIFSGLSAMDTIEEIKKTVPVHTIVDGYAASAGTFISLAGTKRLIRTNSFMLIHQLSSGFWGKYDEIKDEIENLDLFMDIIKNVYKKRSTVPAKQLDAILKKDMFWEGGACKSYGLVDEII
jgi:ATP-dependent Clp endopeptidase proteolytic subunit ClpP